MLIQVVLCSSILERQECGSERESEVYNACW